MKKLLIAISFCLAGTNIFAQQASAPSMISPSEAGKAIPEALLVKQVEFDFGKIPQGKPVTHIFEVTNTGITAFKLDNVQASCGCTTPQWDKDASIAPGANANITVGYNAASEGTFAKSITITYNGHQTRQIIIKGEVWKTPATSAPTNESLNDLKN